MEMEEKIRAEAKKIIADLDLNGTILESIKISNSQDNSADRLPVFPHDIWRVDFKHKDGRRKKNSGWVMLIFDFDSLKPLLIAKATLGRAVYRRIELDQKNKYSVGDRMLPWKSPVD